jgi:hypothetical protein
MNLENSGLPIVGFRSWRIWGTLIENTPGIVGANLQSWPNKNFIGAKCEEKTCADIPRRPYYREDHITPHEKCKCGIYAFHELEELIAMETEGLNNGDRVCGAVIGWGKTVIHQKGFRVANATIIALSAAIKLTPKDAERLNRLSPLLGVPIIKPQFLEAYASEFGNTYQTLPKKV